RRVAYHETSCSMRNRTHVSVLTALVTAARFEVLPTDTIEEKILEHVPVERMLTVTASPAKGLEATLDLTERLLKQGYNVMPHLLISGDIPVQSMWDKRLHATQIVSSLVFDPAAVESWLTRMRLRGMTLPVWLGIPGPAERTKLLSMATKIGVGDSTRFLMKH